MKAIFLLPLLLISVTVSGTLLQSLAQNDRRNSDLEDFVVKAMKNNFTDFIGFLNLDPTPVIADEIELRRRLGNVNITSGKITNQTVFDYSDFTDRYVEATANLQTGYLYVDHGLRKLSISGEYDVEGSVNGSIPINGSGKFNFTTLPDAMWMRLEVSGFEVTSDGYLNLGAGKSRHEVYFDWGVMHFEGLNAGGHEDEVTNVLLEIFDDKRSDTEGSMYPLALYMEAYLTILFANTPLADIIGL